MPSTWASWGNYESGLGSRPLSEPPRFFETNPAPALVLYGPEAHVLWRDFTRRCEVVFTDLVSPFVVERRPLPAMGANGPPQPRRSGLLRVRLA